MDVMLTNSQTLQSQNLLVTGGQFYSSGYHHLTDATEIYEPTLRTWAIRAKLPRAMQAVRATNINDRILIFGKYLTLKDNSWDLILAGGYDGDYHDSIIEYDPGEDVMTPVGQMTEARAAHAISVVKYAVYSHWCE